MPRARAGTLAVPARGRRAAWLAGLALAVALCALGGGRVLAHASLVASEPPAAGQVPDLPPRIALQFSEGVVALTVTVTDQQGKDAVAGAPIIDAADRRRVAVPLRGGTAGVYTVTWSAQSVDGHDTAGSYFFAVGGALPDADRIRAAQQPSPVGIDVADVVDGGARIVLLTAIVTLGGLSLALLLIADEVMRTRAGWRAARRLLLAAAFGVLAGTLLLAARQMASGFGLAPADLARYASSAQGLSAGVRSTVALAAVGALLWVPARRAAVTVCLVAGIGAASSVSEASHTATLVGGPGPVLIDALHLCLAGAWAGGLVLLGMVIPSIASPGGGPRDEARLLAAAARRFSMLAIAGAGIAIAAGLPLAAWHLGSVGDAAGSAYGVALFAKSALVVVALGLGALHRLSLVRRLEAGGDAADEVGARSAISDFRFTVTLELIAVIGIVALSGVMTSTRTATAARGEAAVQPQTLRATAGRLEVGLTVTPGRPGVNIFDIAILEDGSMLHAASSVRLLLELPQAGIALDEMVVPGAHGQWSVVGALSQPGTWAARVLVDTGHTIDAARFTFDARPPAPPAYESDAEFARLLRAAALIAIAITLGGLCLEYMQRRRRRW